jgi:hypothetical protein
MALWTPAAITTRVWIDTADPATITTVSGNISQASDKSGNGFHATQSGLTQRPAYVSAEINGLNIARFDGDDSLFFPSAVVPLNHSMFVVFKNFASNTIGTTIGQWAAGQVGRFLLNTNQISTGAFAPGQINPFNSTATSGAGFQGLMNSFAVADTCLIASNCNLGAEGWQVYKDGSLTDSSTITALFQGVATAIGRLSASTAGSPFVGDFCELVIIAAKESDENRQIVEGYLAWKWGLQGNLPADHPYKNAAPRTGGIIPILRQHYAAMGAR